MTLSLLSRGTEAAAHLALLLVLVNLVFPVINQALGTHMLY